ncbi:MAG: porin family protein [Acidobacteria bacterium]|nr:porin family protein [Acidobacteriota bacterium]
MRTRRAWLWAFIASTLAVPSTARADTFLTPYIGSTFAAKYGVAEPPNKFVYGADLMWLGTSGVGFEIDFAYHPNFFQPGDDEDLFDVDSDGNVVTLMGNLVFGYQGGGIQPYVTGGAGLMRSNIQDVSGFFDDVSDTAFGLNAGGGLRIGGPKLGVRGDLRYFRQLSDIQVGDLGLDLGDFSYWRGTVGVSFGF